MGSDKPRRRISEMLDDDGPAVSEDRVHDALAKILTLDTTPPELARRLHTIVVGQEEAVRRCAVHLRHHLLRIKTCFTQGSRCQPIPKHNLLLIGPIVAIGVADSSMIASSDSPPRAASISCSNSGGSWSRTLGGG